MNVLELFAGIGGLGLGFERAGMAVIGQVEIDPFARAVLSRHWPEVPRHDDVRTAVAWWLSEPRPPVDVVAGGYPCQPESSAGKRRGTADERWLWPEMARVIHAVRPRFVIGENVMGHRTQGLRFVLRDLDRLGYTARAGVVSAEEVGAPHRRARIFVIAELAHAGGSTGRSTPRDAHAGASGEAVCAGASEPGRRSDALANANGARQPQESRLGRVERGRAGNGGPDVPDAGRAGLDAGRSRRGVEGGQPPGVAGRAGAEPVGRGWWAAEPGVGRVAYGVPGRVDRLRVLGNAVVPQVAEYVGQLLLSGTWADA